MPPTIDAPGRGSTLTMGAKDSEVTCLMTFRSALSGGSRPLQQMEDAFSRTAGIRTGRVVWHIIGSTPG